MYEKADLWNFTVFLFELTAVTSAAEEARQAVKQASAATNLTTAYPGAKTKLPQSPVPLSSQEDAKDAAAYIAAVDAYLKTAQGYLMQRLMT